MQDKRTKGKTVNPEISGGFNHQKRVKSLTKSVLQDTLDHGSKYVASFPKGEA